jgi:hypothetical protein
MWYLSTTTLKTLYLAPRKEPLNVLKINLKHWTLLIKYNWEKSSFKITFM